MWMSCTEKHKFNIERVFGSWYSPLILWIEKRYIAPVYRTHNQATRNRWTRLPKYSGAHLTKI